MDTRTREAIRYLGYGRHAIDEPTHDLIRKSFEEMDRIADVKFVYRIFELSYQDTGEVTINNCIFESKSLFKNLKDCNEVILFAITLGTEVDRRLRKYEISNIAKAAVFQACAAAYLEERCNRIQKQFSEELKELKKYLRPRFSPGYGDFSVFHQKEILEMLEASKKIGLSYTESFMLTPTKSVTGLIGISHVDVSCHESGCESCEKADCLYRRS